MTTPFDVFLLWLFIALSVALAGLVVIIFRDIVRHRRHQAQLAAQDRAAKPQRQPGQPMP